MYSLIVEYRQAYLGDIVDSVPGHRYKVNTAIKQL